MFAIKVDPFNLESQNQVMGLPTSPIKIWRKSVQGFLISDRTHKQTDRQTNRDYNFIYINIYIDVYVIEPWKFINNQTWLNRKDVVQTLGLNLNHLLGKWLNYPCTAQLLLTVVNFWFLEHSPVSPAEFKVWSIKGLRHQRSNLKNLSRSLNLSRDSNIVGST